jgi:hypothetical protein
VIREPAADTALGGGELDLIKSLEEARDYLLTRPVHERRALLGAAEWCQVVPLRRLPQASEYRRG